MTDLRSLKLCDGADTAPEPHPGQHAGAVSEHVFSNTSPVGLHADLEQNASLKSRSREKHSENSSLPRKFLCMP
jgi:hypothetical protein